jgi:hypothetical protein
MQFFVADNGSATNITRQVSDYTGSAANSAKLYIEYESSNAEPTVVCVTADDETFNTDTPTLEFEGSDDESDDLRYQVQISTGPDFLPDGVQLTDSEDTSGTSQLVVHPGPVGSLTWEGYQQVDDRVGQVFQGAGGILDKIEFNFGPHETYPEDTDGYYLCRVYAIEGVRGDNVPIWQASTAYTVGQMVRQTSGANPNQQFLYICTTAGTSDSSEPTWTEIEDDEISDGSVVWEAHRGAGPLNFADPEDTPTSDWLAQSEVVAYAPGEADLGWKACSFTGSNRIRLEAGTWYCAILDWRPNDTVGNNTLAVGVRIGATHPGNAYLDGSETANNGPRVGDDTRFKAYEDHVLIDATSGTDAGFANTETGGDTDPFNAGETVSYTVQSGDELDPDVTYYWRVRVSDPDGSNQWSEWTTARTFTYVEATVADAADASHAHAADSVNLTQAHSLVVANTDHGHTAESPAPTQAHSLTVADASHAHAAESPAPAQTHSLIVADASHVHVAESPAPTQAHELALADASHAHVADSVDLTQAHELVTADATHAHSADGAGLAQVHNLAVAEASHAHAGDGVDLAQVHDLAVAETAHAHSAENATLTQTHSLAAADAAHVHTADVPALTQTHSLAAADAVHAHGAENVTLVQEGSLGVADAVHAHTADSVDLTQLHSLLAAGVLHSHSSDTPALVQAHELVAADATHAHAADALVLVQAHAVAAADAAHAHAADALVLGQAHELAAANAAHAHAADGVDLSQLHNILAAGVLHAHSADNVVLQAGGLGVDDVLHGHAADSPILSQVHQLLVATGLSGHTADNLALTIPATSAAVSALMAIAGLLGRLSSEAVISNLCGSRLAGVSRSGMLETVLVQAPGLGMAGSQQLVNGPLGGQDGAQRSMAALSSQQFSAIAGSVAGGMTHETPT